VGLADAWGGQGGGGGGGVGAGLAGCLRLRALPRPSSPAAARRSLSSSQRTAGARTRGDERTALHGDSHAHSAPHEPSAQSARRRLRACGAVLAAGRAGTAAAAANVRRAAASAVASAGARRALSSGATVSARARRARNSARGVTAGWAAGRAACGTEGGAERSL
jgi:hypothetical protein